MGRLSSIWPHIDPFRREHGVECNDCNGTIPLRVKTSFESNTVSVSFSDPNTEEIGQDRQSLRQAERFSPIRRSRVFIKLEKDGILKRMSALLGF